MARRPHALITGASSGIGLELARVFAHRGHDLMLVARDEARLQAVAHELSAVRDIDVRVRATDLSSPEDARALVAALEEGAWPVDTLVNNAGFATYGSLVETDVDVTMEMLAVNIGALTLLTRLVLPQMVARRHGRILNVASTAAFQPGPHMAAYYASKAYVLSFSEAVAEELRGTGVTVTALCPGPTQSGFQARAKMERSRIMRGFLPMMDAASVAVCAYEGLLLGQSVIIPGLVNRLLAVSSRFMPRSWVTRISGWLAAPG